MPFSGKCPSEADALFRQMPFSGKFPSEADALLGQMPFLGKCPTKANALLMFIVIVIEHLQSAIQGFRGTPEASLLALDHERNCPNLSCFSEFYVGILLF